MSLQNVCSVCRRIHNMGDNDIEEVLKNNANLCFVCCTLRNQMCHLKYKYVSVFTGKDLLLLDCSWVKVSYTPAKGAISYLFRTSYIPELPHYSC